MKPADHTATLTLHVTVRYNVTPGRPAHRDSWNGDIPPEPAELDVIEVSLTDQGEAELWDHINDAQED